MNRSGAFALRAERPMTPTKLLIGHIIVVFAIVIAGLWTARNGLQRCWPISRSSGCYGLSCSARRSTGPGRSPPGGITSTPTGRGTGLALAAVLTETGGEVTLVARLGEQIEAVAAAIRSAGGCTELARVDVADLAACPVRAGRNGRLDRVSLGRLGAGNVRPETGSLGPASRIKDCGVSEVCFQANLQGLMAPNV
jgi:hypothetical protein